MPGERSIGKKPKEEKNMSYLKTCVVLLALMLAAMAVVPIVSAGDMSHSKYSKNPKLISEFQSTKSINKIHQSSEFLDYMNAPAITQNEKDQCQRLITDSKGFEKFKDIYQGPTNVVWAYPYSGKQRISTVVGSETSDTYGLYYAYVDPEHGSIIDEGFVNWKKYW
jgi:hypothetical protein